MLLERAKSDPIDNLKDKKKNAEDEVYTALSQIPKNCNETITND